MKAMPTDDQAVSNVSKPKSEVNRGRTGKDGATGRTGNAGATGLPGKDGIPGLPGKDGELFDSVSFIEAMNNMADATRQLAKDFRPKVRQLSYIGRLILPLVVFVAIVAAVNLYNTTLARSGSQQIALTLKAVQDQSNPNSAVFKANQARLLLVINTDIVSCIENHSDRGTALIKHLPLPPIPTGCPG